MSLDALNRKLDKMIAAVDQQQEARVVIRCFFGNEPHEEDPDTIVIRTEWRNILLKDRNEEEPINI